jgi:NDP-sugar pyrophosphorylase family protein
MRAVVLVGGEGTRLRPLTETVPKPLLPLMDRPSLDHVLDHLARHGIHEVVLSSPYLESTFHDLIESRRDPKVTWITEREPLGTGGAIVHAMDHLGDEPFLALNGDILTDLDLTVMAAFHRERAADATIALHHVEDARAFGLVATRPDGRVVEFREKPEEPVPGEVNAGTYILEPGALTGWAGSGNVSIERRIFPALIEAGRRVFGLATDAYWLDLGTPQTYLRAHFDILEGRVGGERYPAPFVAVGAVVDRLAHLGRWVVVGAGASVGPGAEIDDSVLHGGAVVEEGAKVFGSILAPRSVVGVGATVIESVLAASARVRPGTTVRGAKISAGEEASEG